MPNIDAYSYHLGAADCFCEMVRAGVKRLALSHPCDTKEMRDSFLPDFEALCRQYGVRFYIEDDPFLTDLFPVSLNQGKFNVIFYQDDSVLQKYLALKDKKKRSVADGSYDKNRLEIARAYGKLLSYTIAGIDRLLVANDEKEGLY